MVITYLDGSFIRVQLGERVIALNPIAKEADKTASKFGADMALVSLDDPRFNGVAQVTYGAKTPLRIDTPGEYEVGGIYIQGVATDHIPADKKHSPLGYKINTAYTVLLEDVRLCHLGAHQSKTFLKEAVEALGEVDVLFVTVDGGAKDSDKTKAVYEAAQALEPKVVIPLNYGSLKDKKSPLYFFAKEWGQEDVTPIEKYQPKKRELEGSEGALVVLAPSA